MSIHPNHTPTHPDDLEAIADEMEKILDEELLFNLKRDTQSAEAMEVENMMATIFDAKEPEFNIVLFKEDGDYGFISFSGLFECLETAISCIQKKDMEVVVAEDESEEMQLNAHLDFFLVDVAVEPAEVLYGAKLVPNNCFVNM